MEQKTERAHGRCTDCPPNQQLSACPYRKPSPANWGESWLQNKGFKAKSHMAVWQEGFWNFVTMCPKNIGQKLGVVGKNVWTLNSVSYCKKNCQTSKKAHAAKESRVTCWRLCGPSFFFFFFAFFPPPYIILLDKQSLKILDVHSSLSSCQECTTSSEMHGKMGSLPERLGKADSLPPFHCMKCQPLMGTVSSHQTLFSLSFWMVRKIVDADVNTGSWLQHCGKCLGMLMGLN